MFNENLLIDSILSNLHYFRPNNVPLTLNHTCDITGAWPRYVGIFWYGDKAHAISEIVSRRHGWLRQTNRASVILTIKHLTAAYCSSYCNTFITNHNQNIVLFVFLSGGITDLKVWLISQNGKIEVSSWTNMRNFQPHEVVGRWRDTQLQVGENFS